MNELTLRVRQATGKHFVSLSCVQYPPAGAPKILVFSGFVVDVSGEWFYVTAGHIIRDIASARASGSTFDIWRLDDQTAGNQFGGKAVPYDFVEDHWLVLEDASVGMDYAAVHLPDFWRRPLEVGGIAPITRRAWNNFNAEHDHWVLVGIPSETIRYDGETVITGRFVVLPLIAADEPASAGTRANNQFYARPIAESEQVFRDADGLSGGPVFALKKVDGGDWAYGVIGVQSGWYPASKTLAICPFSSFGSALEEVVARTRATQEQLPDAARL